MFIYSPHCLHLVYHYVYYFSKKFDSGWGVCDRIIYKRIGDFFYMKLEKYKQRNPKKIGIAMFTIACVLLIAFVFIYSSFASFQTNETRTFINGDVVDPGDLYFAFYVDGQISKTMPGKDDGYSLVSSTCTNGASVEWLNDEWAPKILNLDKMYPLF